MAQGRKLARKGLIELYTYGLYSRYIGVGAEKAGFARKKIKHFTNMTDLKAELSKQLRPDTILLIKGSTNGNKVKLMHVLEWMVHRAH